ncbi:tetratricopeptide repeat protein [Streptomyces apricus]|uniref:Tetratricopeptide repeat protein n=1 Tax=Streptomyces apricus TaxID=1828112 RepID=A0A5B0ANF9_9ACTN|nr:hypothetical protein [Streptomyces apricus]KAA0930582.1 hypothetical protein FGF04_29005 [Streptomyces apricus]
MAAHITAASPGGPRYDAALTPAERSAQSNGIWLCQNCGKLIDSDVARYSEETLRQWKGEAEQRALKMLQNSDDVSDALVLALPQLDSFDSLLTFASTAVGRIGREGEIEELKSFLRADADFAWWIWTGSAGSGKSRLALELCRTVTGEWHAGLLREGNQTALGGLQPTRPTLIVVDYAAQRGEWLADALLHLSQRNLCAPVRVLILERRAQGPWWDSLQRVHRMEESFQIQACSYGLPRELEGLSRSESRRLIEAVAKRAGVELTSTNVEDIADHAAKMDPEGRPLFVLVAVLDWLDGNGISADRDGALRRLVARMDGQAVQAAGSPQIRLMRNVRTIATALGGLSADDYAQLVRMLTPPAGLLPDVYSDFHLVPLDDLLDGVRPDILGELYVLDQLTAIGAGRIAVMALLKMAWQTNQGAYRAFVERAAGDHREHDCLVDLLDVSDWSASEACARMAVDVIPLLQRNDHPVLDWVFSRLASVRQNTTNETMDELTVVAHFRRATLVLHEGDARRANRLYADALAICATDWPVRSDILNNRGVTWMYLGDQHAAQNDFSTVVESSTATDERRACALNNRADIFDSYGDTSSAIRDRTAVLALAETTYNRRFIAHIRRARTLWNLGDLDGAYQDIDSILGAPDIVTEQKMSARLQRAEWLIETGLAVRAISELEFVCSSERNFDSVEGRAKELLSHLLENLPK